MSRSPLHVATKTDAEVDPAFLLVMMPALKDLVRAIDRFKRAGCVTAAQRRAFNAVLRAYGRLVVETIYHSGGDVPRHQASRRG